MLPVGKLSKGFGTERDTNFTMDEQKTMMSLWCIFRSPLMIGAELPKLDAATMELLTNEQLFRMKNEITISQEIYRDEDFIIWEAESYNKKYAAIFNISKEEKKAPFDKISKDYDGALEIWSLKAVKLEEGFDIPSQGVIVLSKDID